ncbi:MAG: DUF3140 domain-containing protein [Proteobacteria bacterium]|nr:DUF3140 domain-containing protein [Pseudomonadota bacterium]
MLDADEALEIRKAFDEAVNMPPSRLEPWLKTGRSRSVGWVDGEVKHAKIGPESAGHASGRRILEIKRKPVAELTEADYHHMRKVIGYVQRHLAQRPRGDVARTRWRYSLMNWGHDPLKDKPARRQYRRRTMSRDANSHAQIEARP